MLRGLLGELGFELGDLPVGEPGVYGLPAMASQASRYSPGTSVAPSLNPGRAHCCYSSLINMSHYQLARC